MSEKASIDSGLLMLIMNEAVFGGQVLLSQ